MSKTSESIKKSISVQEAVYFSILLFWQIFRLIHHKFYSFALNQLCSSHFFIIPLCLLHFICSQNFSKVCKSFSLKGKELSIASEQRKKEFKEKKMMFDSIINQIKGETLVWKIFFSLIWQQLFFSFLYIPFFSLNYCCTNNTLC